MGNWRSLRQAGGGQLGRLILGAVAQRLGLGHAQYFFGRGHAFSDQTPAILGQRPHAAAPGDFADFAARTALQNHLPNLVAGVHPLEDAVAAMVTGVPAGAAADRAVERNVGGNAILRLSARVVADWSTCLHSGQRTRTRRWASTASSDDATKYGSTPMSTRRVKAPGASFVCRVENTRWPVSDAWTAICAVS